MITLTVGMNLKCLTGMGIHNDTFYDDIMSGYNLFSLDFSAQELLLLLMDKNGGDEQPYSMTNLAMTTLVNIENRNETENFNVQIVNHFVNTFVRLLRGAGTYRDYLYVDNFLGKAGVNDTYNFTKIVSNYIHNIENKARLDNIYKNIADSGLQDELKKYFESSNVSLIKEDNRYNKNYVRYLEAVRSNAEFIMNLPTVGFGGYDIEPERIKSCVFESSMPKENRLRKDLLKDSVFMSDMLKSEVLKSKFLMEILGVNKNAERLESISENQELVSAKLQIIEKYSEENYMIEKYHDTHNNRYQKFNDIDKEYDMPYQNNSLNYNSYKRDDGHTEKHNDDYTQNLQYEINKIQENSAVHNYVDELYAANITADMYINPFIAIWKDTEYGITGADKYFNSDLQEIFASTVCEIIKQVYQNGVQESINIENKNTHYFVENTDIKNRQNTEIFQIENSDIDTVDIIDNIYKLMHEKFAYVQNYREYVDGRIENYYGKLNIGNGVYSKIDGADGHEKNDIRHIDGNTDNNVRYNMSGNMEDDIQYKENSYQTDELNINITENDIIKSHKDNANSIKDSIRNNIEYKINDIKNNIENNSDKKTVINVAENKLHEKSETINTVFMDNSNEYADRKHIEQCIDLAEQFLVSEKIYMKNRENIMGQTAEYAEQNDISQNDTVQAAGDVILHTENNINMGNSGQSMSVDDKENNGAVILHIDNQNELQQLENLLNFEFNRVGKTNIFHDNINTENNIVKGADLQNIERKNILQNIESQNVLEESQNILQESENISGKNESILQNIKNKNIVNENISEEYIVKKITDSKTWDVSKRYLKLQSFVDAMKEIIHTQLVNEYSDMSNVINMNYILSPQNINSDSIHFENIKNINPEAIDYGNEQNIGLKSIHFENEQNMSSDSIHSENIKNINSERVHSENIENISSKIISSEDIHSENARNVKNIYSEDMYLKSIQNIYPQNQQADIYTKYINEKTRQLGKAEVSPGISQSKVILTFPSGNVEENGESGMYDAQQMVQNTTVKNVSTKNMARNYTSNISNATDVTNYGYSDSVFGGQGGRQGKDYENVMERKINNVIANQINNISERVYGQLERRLENERRRRGR